MSGEVRRLPPYRVIPHLKAAFGGVFGILNLLVGAVSIFRQMARALDVGLSPVLKNIFAAYVQIFHGLVDFFAGALTWITGFDLSVPVWAHDWIILWFVGAGSAFRVVIAFAKRTDDEEGTYSTVSRPGGYLIWGVVVPLATFLSQLVFDAMVMVIGTTEKGDIKAYGAIGLASSLAFNIVAYLICAFAWPLMLAELFLFRPVLVPAFTEDDDYDESDVRFSFLAIFWLQTFGIAGGIFGLSVLNAQTMGG